MRAVVIGAGIGGLAAGLSLRRAGFDVEIFERAGALQEVGAGISLWANAIHALDQLGLGDTVRSFGAPYSVAGLRTWNGRILTAPSPELERKLGVLCIVMHRAELRDALFQAFGPEHVHLGARCERLQQDADGVSAELADGRRTRADILVGADGLHSVVRSQLHGFRQPRYSGYTAWRGVVTFDAGRVRASESWGYGARFGQVPMRGGRVYWFATQNTAEGAHAASEKMHLLRLFRGWHDPVESLIDATGEPAILRNDIYDRPPLGKWSVGRVTLLGDAAHPMTPNLGQGACQALEDAVVLARSLQEQLDPVAALRAYEAQRTPRTSMVVRYSRRAGMVGQWESPVAVFLRNALISRVSPRLQERELERVVGYKV